MIREQDEVFLFRKVLLHFEPSYLYEHCLVHDFVNMVDHRKYNETVFKEFLNPARFAHISGASKYIRSAQNLIPLAPLVQGLTSEPKIEKRELNVKNIISIVNVRLERLRLLLL